MAAVRRGSLWMIGACILAFLALLLTGAAPLDSAVLASMEERAAERAALEGQVELLRWGSGIVVTGLGGAILALWNSNRRKERELLFEVKASREEREKSGGETRALLRETIEVLSTFRENLQEMRDVVETCDERRTKLERGGKVR